MSDRILPGDVERARRLRKGQTVAERLLWAELRLLKANVRRQAPIGRYIVDFFHPASRLVIEIDGPVHDEPEHQLKDLERTDWLTAQGYRVVRFAERDVRDRLDHIVTTIAAELASPQSPPLAPSKAKGESRYQVR
jgi:very-short-patch-repair endonuclease